MDDIPQSFKLWLFQVIVLSGLLVLLLWLTFRPSSPTYTVINFSIPSNDSNASLTIEFANGNRDGGVYCTDMIVTIYFDEENAGEVKPPSFYQQHGESTLWTEGGQIHGRAWKPVVDAFLNQTAKFEIALAAKVKYKVLFWKSKLHGMNMGARLCVGKDGKLNRKKVKMHHRATKWHR